MSTEALAQFQHLLFFDDELQATLRAIDGQDEFAERMVALGRERSLEFSVEEVIAVMKESRRQWIQRWVA